MASSSSSNSLSSACFGAGCFWGVERYFRKEFGKEILNGAVGYMGGDDKKFPKASYKEVCSGETGHAEVFYFQYNKNNIKYEKLVEYFYRIHDATTLNRQGNDRGTQYRSSIFYYSEEQKLIAEKITKEIQEKHYKESSIVTEIVSAEGKHFWPAEEYHQKYLEANPGGYCNHRLRW